MSTHSSGDVFALEKFVLGVLMDHTQVYLRRFAGKRRTRQSPCINIGQTQTGMIPASN